MQRARTDGERVERRGAFAAAKVALKTGVAITEASDMFRSVMQRCLNEGVLPAVWKRQSLVLLPKTGKPPGDPSACRPICLLDTEGKVLERIILIRLLKYTDSAVGMSSNFYGFRKGSSTVYAVLSATKTAEIALQCKRRRNPFLCDSRYGASCSTRC